MNASTDLRLLAAAPETAPPFGFDEFERRRAATLQRRRATNWSLAAAGVVIGLVPVLALLTQGPEPAALVAQSTAEPAPSAVEVFEQPALVDLGQFAVTSELEDHIALLDAEISAAQVHAVPAEKLRQMESTRQQLNDSLQRVSYAQSLLNL
jgi:hypothetical protein